MLNVLIDERDGNIRIWESYRIRRRAQKRAVLEAIMQSPLYNPAVFPRTRWGYQMEWSAHNLAWRLLRGKLRARAADVDLNNGKCRLFKAVYAFVTLFGLLNF